jgi:hypothetical protein
MKNFIERLEQVKKTKSGNKDFDAGFICAVANLEIIYNELHPQTETIAPEPNKGHTEGSFKVRVIKSGEEKWYYDKIGREFEVVINDKDWYQVADSKTDCILKSDCEIIPETTVIPFDYQRWKDGDYVRVVTKNGRLVDQLVEFKCDGMYPMSGVLENKKHSWKTGGEFYITFGEHLNDLHLEIAKPKEKEKLFTADDMELCFNESRLKNPFVGFKHDSFNEFLNTLTISI